jgi:5'-3' exonuclease
MYERKSGKITDEAGALQRLGVMPAQVPAWLALVGDSADGIPGIARWGEKSAATVLNHYKTIDAIPDDASTWSVKVRGKDALAASLASSRADAKLYETLATLRTDVPLTESLDDLKWRGARMSELRALCEELGANDVLERLPVPSETA